MMMLFQNLCRILSVVIAITAAEAKELKVVTEVFFPFQYLDDSGAPQGPAYHIAKSIMTRAGQASRIDFIAWTRAYNMALNTPNVAIFSMMRTQSRENNFHWIGPITRIDPAALYSIRARNLPTYETIEEYKKHKLCAQESTPPYKALIDLGFEVGVNLFPAGDVAYSGKRANGALDPVDLEWYRVLNSPQCEYRVSIPATMSARIVLSGTNPHTIVKHNEVPMDFPKNRLLYLALSKDSDSAIIENLHKTYKKMKYTGEIRHICETDLGKNAYACDF